MTVMEWFDTPWPYVYACAYSVAGLALWLHGRVSIHREECKGNHPSNPR